jgi:carboxymethylenebutenolidase
VADIEVETAKDRIEARLELPTGDGPWPGVVVVHDMTAFNQDIKNITRKIADNGYIALAPNLYSRGGPVLCVRRVITDLFAHRGRAIDDIVAARETLAARADCTGSIGIVGFCMGGGFALVMASQGFDASAPFYPSLLQNYDNVVDDDACPIVASFGKRDPILQGRGPKLEKTLERKGIPHDVKVYDGVGHSFANQLPAQPLLRITGFGYGAEQSEDAWGRVFGFFDTHLAPQT